MKRCPYCKEEIHEEATKCRFCLEWIVSGVSHGAMANVSSGFDKGGRAGAPADGAEDAVSVRRKKMHDAERMRAAGKRAEEEQHLSSDDMRLIVTILRWAEDWETRHNEQIPMTVDDRRRALTMYIRRFGSKGLMHIFERYKNVAFVHAEDFFVMFLRPMTEKE